MLGAPNPALFATCFGLLATCCLTPPAPKVPATEVEADSSSTETAPIAKPVAKNDPGPKQFGTATSAAPVADLTLGWNVGNSLDVPDGETAWRFARLSGGIR